MRVALATDVCVIGGGPAGSVCAARLAQLGHDVCLIERAGFPRRRLGECLAPGVGPLLDVIGCNLDTALALPAHAVYVKWDHDGVERIESASTRLVDRGRFDALLLNHARKAGVNVLQPATVRSRTPRDDGWMLGLAIGSRDVDLRAAFVVDATGRTRLLRQRRSVDGPRTVALYAYWSGQGLPRQPRIQAGVNEWYWGVPLPDGTYNTLVFVDRERVRQRRTTVHALFQELILASSVLDGASDLRMTTGVLACDATPNVAEEIVTPTSIRIGDAAIAIDPIASSGVQKAIQTALAGAIVVNTLVRRRSSRDAAMQFYRDSLHHAAERHRRWAAGQYARVAARSSASFWRDRAVADTASAPTVVRQPTEIAQSSPLDVSPQLTFVNVPCIIGDFVTMKEGLRHPDFDEPLAFLGGEELAPLLRNVRAGMTLQQVTRAWAARRVPPRRAAEIAAWLVRRRLLISSEGCSY